MTGAFDPADPKDSAGRSGDTDRGAREWDAAAYARLSEPQFQWGLRVLERVALRGDELAVDLGCGSGRLTAVLAERLPRGRVVAVDRSANMVAEARAALAPLSPRVSVVEGDALALEEVVRGADLIFSTATLHWVLEHDALFPALAAALAPGGRLEAQCGGQGNLAGALSLAARCALELGLERALGGRYPAYFAGDEETRVRLGRAGFQDVEVWLEATPTPFDDAETFRAFLEKVVLRTLVARLEPADAARLLDEVVRRAAAAGPLSLDYVRLNVRARRA